VADPFTREERDEIVARMFALWARLFPPDGSPPLDAAERNDVRERYYQALGEYGDRLPRVVMSACPFTGTPLKRAWDPYGFDGPWWPVSSTCEIAEPRGPETFQVLLGALGLRREKPTETRDAVKPGPEVPFVVPALLGLPGMVAVVGELTLETGDKAYPVAYFSEAEIAPQQLHQPWLRDEFWFTDAEGNESWSMATDVWDFELAPYLESGQLRWVLLDEPTPRVRRLGVQGDGPYPFADLPGERLPQIYVDGERDFLGLPDGRPAAPFGDPEDEEMPEDEREMANFDFTSFEDDETS
jgi:hypothetical protein